MLWNLGLVHPAYDYVLKCSHTFNLLDARGAVSVTERAGYIARIRNLARVVAKTFVAERKNLVTHFSTKPHAKTPRRRGRIKRVTGKEKGEQSEPYGTQRQVKGLLKG